MQKNENKIFFESSNQNINKPLLQQDIFQNRLNEKKHYFRKSLTTRINLNTNQFLRKYSEQKPQQKRNAWSSNFLNRKRIFSVQKITDHKTNNSVNSVFKRRVHSQSRPSFSKGYAENSNSSEYKRIKISFGQKLIQDLKKATFKMKKNSQRYQSPCNVSKSEYYLKKDEFTQRQSRQKILQKSIQKLKPSINVNEVKLNNSRNSLRKSSRQSHQQMRIARTMSSKKHVKKQYDIPNQNKNEQILQKMLKISRQPLDSYRDFIKGHDENEYRINVDYLSQYGTQKKQPHSKSIFSQIDFSTLKLLSSIYLCLIDILVKNEQKGRELRINKKQVRISEQEIEVVKQYIEVYFHTYSRMKLQYMICETLFQQQRKRLYGFFLMQRMLFYCLHQRIIFWPKISQGIIQFLKSNQQIHKTITNTLHESSLRNDRIYGEIHMTERKTIDNCITMKLTKQLGKHYSKMKQTVDNLIQKHTCSNQISNQQSLQIVSDIVRSLVGLMQKVQNDQISSMKQIYQLEQYFNWTLLSIPPLFYLPPSPSKHYTLIIDLDGTLIFYNEETKILKYRPYIDRFLTQMKKHFELVVFSSHPKQRTDIIVQQIQRDQKIFDFKLYRKHMVFQQGGLRKNVGYLGRNIQRVILVDDEEKNTEWLPLNSYKIESFMGDKKDKQLLNLSDRLTALIQTQPIDIRGKLKQVSSSLYSVPEVDEVSSTIQPSIQYSERIRNQKYFNSQKKI